MRTHEGNDRAHNWSWDSDEETIAHFRRFVRIHHALSSEIEGLARQAAENSTPILCHMMLNFPEDRETWPISDQFMLGPDLLVAPILSEDTTQRSIYLPEGVWFHLWTGQRYEGRQWIEIQAPIGAPPVFSRNHDRPELRAISEP